MSDEIPPGDEPTSAAADVWARLRDIEDMEPRRPARLDPSDAPAEPPHTAIQPRTPEPTTGVPDEPTTPGGGRYYVPAPDAPAVSAAAGAAKYQATMDAKAPQPRRAPAAAGSAAPPPSGRDRSRGRRSANPLRPKLKWFRPKLRWFFLYLPLLVMLAIGGAGFWAWNTFNGLYRVDLGDALAPVQGSAVNYLIVGSDSREGIDASTPNVGAIGTGSEVTGRRSDTIIVLRVDGDTAKMVSIPRDLWVRNAATGRNGRINATYAAGPANLVRSITANLGIPINRYLEVDFVSFAGMVDAVGGIDIDFAHPAMDLNSGLRIPTAGTHRLDGSMALAYVRSRHYVEEIDGKPVPQGNGDIGREQRQQTFIRTVLKTVGGTRNPITLMHVGTAAAKGVRIDSEVGFGDLLGLARQLGGADPQTKVLPTVNARKGQAAVLLLDNAGALPVLAEFGAGSG
ncbi:MAG: LCP family protein [Acidimicrobiales bacterium]